MAKIHEAASGEGHARCPSNDDDAALWQREFRERRVEVLGCKLDRLDLDQTLAVCNDVIQSRGFAQHMAINVAKLMAMRENEILRERVAGCELVTADGQAVVWASRLLGDTLPVRVAGIDLMDGL